MDEQEFATWVGKPLWGGTALSRDPYRRGPGFTMTWAGAQDKPQMSSQS